MSKALEAGQWCKPRNEQEWKAVLDLAESLGLGCRPLWPRMKSRYGKYNRIFKLPLRHRGEISDLSSDCPMPVDNKLLVPDFIAGMYALAEQSKPETMIIPPTGSFTDRYFQGTDPIPSETEADLRRRLKFMEDTIASLDASPDELVGVRQLRLQRSSLGITDINTRLSNLEAAFNEHLVKERRMLSSSYICRPYCEVV